MVRALVYAFSMLHVVLSLDTLIVWLLAVDLAAIFIMEDAHALMQSAHQHIGSVNPEVFITLAVLCTSVRGLLIVLTVYSWPTPVKQMCSFCCCCSMSTYQAWSTLVSTGRSCSQR